jgi:glutamine synthetase
VPYTLEHAVDLFAASDFARNTFGAEVVEHYTHFFRAEQKSVRFRRNGLGTPPLLRAI